MPDQDARDSYIEVEIELPNGAKVVGHSIPFRKGLTIKALLYRFSETIEQVDFDKMWSEFEQATAVTEARLEELCPSMTLLELTDLISRFIYVLRPGRTAARQTTGTPVSTAAPAATPPAPTAGSGENAPATTILRAS